AAAGGIIPPETGHFMVIVTGLSILVTPGIFSLAEKIYTRLEAHFSRCEETSWAMYRGDISGHVIIAGFGRSGKIVAEMMDAAKIPYIALDSDSKTVSRHARGGAARL